MKSFFRTVIVLALGAVCSAAIASVSRAEDAPAAKPALNLPRGVPEAQGVSSAAVLDFVDTVDREINSLNSVMIVRHGQVVAEGWWTPYNPESRHELYSLSKSFTSTAVGLAIAEEKLSLDDQVIKFFPGDVPASPSDNLKNMRVRDLLAMSTGHQDEPPVRESDQPWTKTFLAQPVPHKPGTHFKYNTPATYMQSAIVQKQTGMPVLEFLRPRLFEPLGIVDPTWGTSPQGVSLGGYGLNVRTEDIAKFGQLYLQKGKWNGKQLIPAAWVEAATSRQTSNGSNPDSDWDQGYGYQFWRSRHGAYRGDGAFGQYCIVIPKKDAVIAITGGLRDMQSVLNHVWVKLLPGLQAYPIPPNPSDHDKLKARLASLTLPLAKGEATSPNAAKFTGKTFRLETNPLKLETVALSSDDKGEISIQLNGADRQQKIACGSGKWILGRCTLVTPDERPAAACGAWSAPDTYTARICFYETPFVATLNLKFADDTIVVDAESNVGFGPTKLPQLTGHVEK